MSDVNRKSRALLLICFGVIWVCLIYSRLPAADKIPIFLYSSETNINNFKSLKMEFDAFLSKHGAYEFQPFGDLKTFENIIKKSDKCIMLLSSWHLAKIQKDFSLKPILVGIRNGKKYQKRILVASEKNADMKIAAKGPVASSSNEPFTRSVLKGIFPEGSIADSIRILTVPKDVDALMSVGFEMAKCALTTEAAVENLKKLDAALYSKLKILAEGKDSLLMIAAIPVNFGQDADKPIQLIREMVNTPDGLNIIKMLDLDGWQIPDQSDLQHLEG